MQRSVAVTQPVVCGQSCALVFPEYDLLLVKQSGSRIYTGWMACSMLAAQHHGHA